MNSPPLLNSEFWVGWTFYINSLLDLLTPASKLIQLQQIREELHFVYNEQFNRLTQRIGSKEFAVIIGWSQPQLAAFRNNGDNFPLPVEIFAATPIWTLGQAENFLRIIDARKVLKKRGDWSSMQKQDLS